MCHSHADPLCCRVVLAPLLASRMLSLEGGREWYPIDATFQCEPRAGCLADRTHLSRRRCNSFCLALLCVGLYHHLDLRRTSDVGPDRRSSGRCRDAGLACRESPSLAMEPRLEALSFCRNHGREFQPWENWASRLSSHPPGKTGTPYHPQIATAVPMVTSAGGMIVAGIDADRANRGPLPIARNALKKSSRRCFVP